MVNIKAHAAYGNKIARGVIQENIWGVNEVVVIKVGAALKNFPLQNQKKHIEVPRTQQQKRQKEQTLTTHAPPPQIANFPFQCIERKFTLRSIIRDINVAHSQL